MKTIKQKITAPDGYIIDQEKSTFEEIVFKPIEDEWVDSWEQMKKIEGYYIASDCQIITVSRREPKYHYRNTFPTKQDAESALALAQLLQLRKRVIGDWEADWGDKNIEKYCIARYLNVVECVTKYESYEELSFPTAKMRDKFLDKYRDLINIYFKIK